MIKHKRLVLKKYQRFFCLVALFLGLTGLTADRLFAAMSYDDAGPAERQEQVCQKCGDDKFPVHHAASVGHPHCLSILIGRYEQDCQEHGGDFIADILGLQEGANHTTPFHCAVFCTEDNGVCLNMLIAAARGAGSTDDDIRRLIGIQDRYGNTALHYTVDYSNRANYACARILLQNGAAMDILNNHEQTAFDRAIELARPYRVSPRIEMLTILMGGDRNAAETAAAEDDGIVWDCEQCEQESASKAAYRGHCHCLRRHLENLRAGAANDFDFVDILGQQDEHGMTLIHWAVISHVNQGVCLKLLIAAAREAGATDEDICWLVNIQDYESNTALHYAADFDDRANPVCARILCRNGAFMNIPNNVGKTAVAIARRWAVSSLRRTEVFEILQAEGHNYLPTLQEMCAWCVVDHGVDFEGEVGLPVHMREYVRQFVDEE